MEPKNETGTDTNTSVEPTNEPTVETNASFDDLLNAPDDLLPPVPEGGSHTGMQPLHSWLKHVPEDVRKHLANYRADYTRKTQDLARQRDTLQGQLEAERAALQAERETLYNGEAAKRARELAQDTTAYDMFDPEQVKKELERQAAIQFNSMIAPVQEQLAQERARLEADRFVREHPDLQEPEMKAEVARLLMAREDMTLEDAYHIARGKLVDVRATKLAEEQTKLKAEQEAVKAKQRATFGKTSAGTPGANRPASGRGFDSTWAAYEAAKLASNKR